MSGKRKSANDDNTVVKPTKKVPGDIWYMNSKYQTNAFKASLSHAFSKQLLFKEDDTGAILYDQPFQLCSLPEFISDISSLPTLKSQLRKIKLHKKFNDLYSFNQSADLKETTFPLVKSFRTFLVDDVLPWLKEITGIPLYDTVDMTCSLYKYGDVLLCHDDELEGRRIAYIFYLVPQWSNEDGGTLELFSTDGNGLPKDIVQTLVPEWNSFTFFEVTPVSFHQVHEVLSDKNRLSINGWFHGPPVSRPEPYQPAAQRLLRPVEVQNELENWINPVYLNIATQIQIRKRFEEDSEIQLLDFLLEDRYKLISNELDNNATLEWQKEGTPNKCNIVRAVESSLSQFTKQCFDVFNSAEFFSLLANLTGLSIGGCRPLFYTDSNSDLSDDDAVSCESASGTALNIEKDNSPAYSIDKDENCDQDTADMESELENHSTILVDKETWHHLKDERSRDVSAIISNSSKNSSCKPCCRGGFRRWRRGCYTLMFDSDPDMTEFGLDLLIYFGCTAWLAEFGGSTVYVAKEEDEELLTIQPVDNTLSLVYRDMETSKFVQYINHRVLKPASNLPHPWFTDLALTYIE